MKRLKKFTVLLGLVMTLAVTAIPAFNSSVDYQNVKQLNPPTTDPGGGSDNNN